MYLLLKKLCHGFSKPTAWLQQGKRFLSWFVLKSKVLAVSAVVSQDSCVLTCTLVCRK